MSSKTAETDLIQGVLNNSEWEERWIQGDIGFHTDEPDKFLKNREEEIFEGKSKSVFVPLCGKTPDIFWMYTHGHTVCGVEISEKAVQDFFVENKLEYNIEEIKDVGNAYKSKDDRIRLFASDIFDLSPQLIGLFDVIWDRRSIIAINKCDRNQYSNLLLSLLKRDGMYILSTMEYDPTAWPGPPHSIPDDTIKTLYGELCDIVTVEEIAVDTSKKPEQKDGPSTMPKTDEALLSIRSSSYLYFRWYKLTFKQSK